MTPSHHHPHLGPCHLCEQGLLRVIRCLDCDCSSVVCDECEALWSEARTVRQAQSAPDSQYPHCPHCGRDNELWEYLSAEELSSHGLDDLIVGESL